MSDAALNPETLEALKACAEPGHGNFLREVLDAYLDDADARLEEMRAAHRSGDAPALARTAHTLKGSSLNVGAERLSALLQAMESEAKQGRLPEAARLGEAEAEFARVKDQLAAYRD